MTMLLILWENLAPIKSPTELPTITVAVLTNVPVIDEKTESV
jgi:hypothetical protein